MEGTTSGTSKKEHLLRVMQQTGKVPPELEPVLNPPEILFYLWKWLRELAVPLSFSEVRAWQELTGRRLSHWELDALIKLDKVRQHG